MTHKTITTLLSDGVNKITMKNHCSKNAKKVLKSDLINELLVKPQGLTNSKTFPCAIMMSPRYIYILWSKHTLKITQAPDLRAHCGYVNAWEHFNVICQMANLILVQSTERTVTNIKLK